jgi:osmotically inducible protein OsmC
MALSLSLANEGMTAESIDTKADVSFEKVGEAWTITESHLDTTVKIPGGDKAKFQKAAEGAKAGCPISRLLNTKITLDAKLV